MMNDETRLIVATIACFGAFFIFGASGPSLGAALPEMAERLNKPESSLGIIFTTRGIGIFIGTIGFSSMASIKGFPLSKQYLTCVVVVFTGLMTLIISWITNFRILVVIFALQGMGFGGINTLANCVLPELWGNRVQPWLQALHSIFGIGAIIGPAVVGLLGYQKTFFAISILSVVPIVFLSLASDNKPKGIEKVYDKVNRQDDDIEMLSLSASSTTATTASSDNENQTNINANIKDVPLSIKILIFLFYILYVGAENGYAGWVPTFSLVEDCTDSISYAAYLTAVVWGALTLGRMIAIVLAIYLSATTMMRIQLFLGITSAICIMVFANISYYHTVWTSFYFGYAMSSIFPLAIVIVGDYGYKIDSATTTLFMAGATFGDAIVPVSIGIFMNLYGPMSLTYIVFVCVTLLVLIYITVHYIASNDSTTTMMINIERQGGSIKGDNSVYSKLHASHDSSDVDNNTVNDSTLGDNDNDEDIVEISLQ